MAEKQRLIITNNPMVKASLLYSSSSSGNHELVWIEGLTEDVLTAVRDYCHRHHRLVTHPLTGSIKPNQTPFKTVVLEPADNGVIDHQSINIAETSLSKTHDMLKFKARPNFKESVIHDFAVIDLSLFESYLETLN